MSRTTDGNYRLFTYFFATPSNPNDLGYFIQLNNQGDTLWTRVVPDISPGRSFSTQQPWMSKGDAEMLPCADGGAVLFFTDYEGLVQEERAVFIRSDSLGYTYGSLLQGNVFLDADNDCLRGLGETPFGDLIVKATEASGLIRYANVFPSGQYSFALPDGSYTLEADIQSLNPYLEWSPTCSGFANPYTLSSASGQAFIVQVADIPVHPTAFCPFVETQLSASLFRFMDTSSMHYTIHSCNHGTADANNVQISVDLDPALSLSSTHPLPPLVSQSGNQFVFALGTLAMGQCTDFQLFLEPLDTGLVGLGQTLCTQVHILPDSLCLSNYWNGALVVASAECQNDTVTFTLENNGADMPQPRPYYVFEDHVMLRQGNYQLNNGQTIAISQAATEGKTYRIEAAQENGFPNLLGDSTASAWVEACIPLPFGNMYSGATVQFYNDNPSPFVAVHCQNALFAYDPNRKAAQPVGYGTAHYIEANTPLQYTLHFQNTGNYPATNVVLRDTLSPFLDPASIQLGAASHAYTWSLSGEGFLEIRFDGIQLPDSTTNEPASHGYVQFAIQQQLDNPIGTLIENRAGIYFDLNPPIITNTVFHTIGDDFYEINLVGTDQVLVPGVQVLVYPNPFQQEATLELRGMEVAHIQVRMTDLLGREVKRLESNDNRVLLDRSGLSQGLYFYEVYADGELVNVGQVVVR